MLLLLLLLSSSLSIHQQHQQQRFTRISHFIFEFHTHFTWQIKFQPAFQFTWYLSCYYGFWKNNTVKYTIV